MEGEERRRRPRRPAGADQHRHQPHLADRGVGEHRLGVALGQPPERRAEGAGEAERDQRRAGRPLRQHQHEPAEPRLHHGARQDRRGRHRGGRMRQRQPHMERHEARLDPEARHERRHRGRSRRPGAERRAHGVELEAAGGMGPGQQADQQADLADERHDDIDAPRPQRRLGPVVHHEEPRRERHRREGDVEGRDVQREEHAEIACQRQAPEARERREARPARHRLRGQPGDQPEPRRQPEQQPPGRVQPEGDAEQQVGRGGHAPGARHRQPERRQRRQRQQAQRARPQRRQRRRRPEQERPDQRRERQEGPVPRRHGSHARSARSVAQASGLTGVAARRPTPSAPSAATTAGATSAGARSSPRASGAGSRNHSR